MNLPVRLLALARAVRLELARGAREALPEQLRAEPAGAHPCLGGVFCRLLLLLLLLLSLAGGRLVSELPGSTGVTRTAAAAAAVAAVGELDDAQRRGRVLQEESQGLVVCDVANDGLGALELRGEHDGREEHAASLGPGFISKNAFMHVFMHHRTEVVSAAGPQESTHLRE